MSHLEEYLKHLEVEKGAEFSRISMTILQLGVELGIAKPKLGQAGIDKLGAITSKLGAEILILRGIDVAEFTRHQKAMCHLIETQLKEDKG